MVRLLKLVVKNLKAKGLSYTLSRVLHFAPIMLRRYTSLSFWVKRRNYQQMLKQGDAKSRFAMIYERNLWSEPESASGTGSTLKYTENIRKELPLLFQKYQIGSLLDAPCGDFNWMADVLISCPDLDYVGGDIVDEIITRNQSLHASERKAFRILDITTDPLPSCQLMLVRDCLFHLSFEDISRFLVNLARSDIQYLLTTSHVFTERHINRDIVSGDFRWIDLFEPPFNFPGPPLERIEDWAPPEHERELCLFRVSDLPH